MLRSKLRTWNVEVFGWLGLKVDEEVKELDEIDEVMITNGQHNANVLVEKYKGSYK